MANLAARSAALEAQLGELVIENERLRAESATWRDRVTRLEADLGRDLDLVESTVG